MMMDSPRLSFFSSPPSLHNKQLIQFLSTILTSLYNMGWLIFSFHLPPSLSFSLWLCTSKKHSIVLLWENIEIWNKLEIETRNEWCYCFWWGLLWVCWAWSYWKIWKSKHLFLFILVSLSGHFWCSMFILNLGSCCLHMFEFNLIKFDAFCSIMKFWAKELQRQCMISIPFSNLCLSLELFDVKVCIFIHCCALIVADIEPLMSMKGLKWHGTKWSFMSF